MSSSTSSLPSASSARPNPVVADHQTLIDRLKAILSRPSPAKLSSADLQLVFTSLASPASSSLSSSARSLSLAILARAYPSTPTSQPSKEELKTLTETLTSLLSGTDSNDLVAGLSALSALVQVSPTWTTVSLLSSSESTTLVQHLISAVEHISINTSSTGNSKGKEPQSREQAALIELLSIASGQSKLRKLIRDSSNDWLDSLLGSPKKKNGSSEKLIKAMAALTVVKLRLGSEPKEQGGATTTSSAIKEEQEVPKWSLEDLCGVFSELFVEETKPEGTISLPLDPTKEAVLLASLEGLAYLTLVPTVALKDQLVSNNGEFLRPFLALLPKLYSKPTGTSSTPALDFSIATLLSHLVKFPEPLDSTSDQAQLNRLKNFASAQAKSPLQASQTETKEQVTSRMDRIISASPIPTLRHFCLSSSLQTRRLAGTILHALVTPQAKRGLLLQAGVARLLLFLIRRQPTPISIEEGDIEPIQALTKLLISTNPSLVFPDPSLLLEALNIISIPLKPTPSTATLPLLTIFESLMALTNLTSLAAELANHLASAEQGILKSLHEEGLISSHPMIQRASTELVCNLVNSPNGVEFYSVGTSSTLAAQTMLTQRLSILLALCSSEDGATRLAASGALAILCSHSEEIAFVLCLEQGMNGLERMGELVQEEDEGLRHRGLDVLSSILGAVERCQVAEKRKEGVERLKKGGILRGIKECEISEKVGMLKELAGADRKVLERLLGI
ncbi:BZ3500_MvSof-1268-A1-R1_Chr7-1g09454 [Microbotryum saponariae]|uniref:BZ3500_MvSof-1268-A1-R1_Chr7-1g09454 protein n=1 Tax=Microbotryum saponariae TaxID=289078 RepID=A0A2X0LEI6_9BASI|nr:BZ3501_MvSof-1269-A2-R1_Chr7-1g09159 [Microbotryum saponariae]SDA03480.1 BZ3500_MvSof-1268-A1-R1_Chr7-1g09454 [Microbotryum saponariae]